MKLNFSQDRIRKLPKPEHGRIEYHDTGCPKLTCRVSHTGSKSFVIIKKNAAGKTLRVTVGRFPDISVAQARELTRDVLRDISRGVDPIEKRKREKRQTITLRELLEQYISQKNLRPVTELDYRKKCRLGFDKWMDKPVNSITRDMVLARHKILSTNSTAHRDNQFRTLRLLLNYGIATKVLRESPVDVLKEIGLWSKPKRKDRIIPSDKLKQWYEAVLNLNNQRAKVYLLMLLYTGLRDKEARTLKWANVDLKKDTLTLLDTKNHTDFTAHIAGSLKPHLLKLQALTGNDEFVFSGTGKNGYMSTPSKQISLITKRTGIQFSSHDLRRLFATIAEAVLLPETLIKKLLNHMTDGDVTGGYIRTEDHTQKEAINKISDYIQTKIEIDLDNVYHLQRRKGDEL